MIYPIRTVGDPVLRMEAANVGDIDDSIRKLVLDLIETMYEAPGVGLAAPQIGVSKRVAVFDAQDDEGARALINPEVIETSGSWEFDEGCLSVPGHFWPITRPGLATVRALNTEGEEVEYQGDELVGRILQHEVDHLDGLLLIERLDKKARKHALRDLRDEALGLATFE